MARQTENVFNYCSNNNVPLPRVVEEPSQLDNDLQPDPLISCAEERIKVILFNSCTQTCVSVLYCWNIRDAKQKLLA